MCVVWVLVACFSASQPVKSSLSPYEHGSASFKHRHTNMTVGAAIPLIPVMYTCCALKGGEVRVCSEGRGEAASTNTSVATGRMAVEGYFLPLCSAVFLVTPLQFVNLAALLKHKTDSTSLLFPHQIHPEHTVLLHYVSLCFFSGNKD